MTASKSNYFSMETHYDVWYDYSNIHLVHVVLSLIGIGSGLVVAFGLLNAKRLDG